MEPGTTLTWIDPQALDGEALRELARFVARYEDIPFEECARHLRALSLALVGRHPSGEIGALAAARILTVTSGGRARTVVWGDWCLFDPAFRGRLLMERALVKGLWTAFLRSPRRPLYFMAEAASTKGYLALARAFAGVWPMPGRALPDAERAMVEDVLAEQRDPDWDPGRGVFHRGKPMRDSVRGARVPERLLGLAAFYRSLNPGQPEGDSLVCVARCSWATLLGMPARALLAWVR
jgi:hypothetical protein